MKLSREPYRERFSVTRLGRIIRGNCAFYDASKISYTGGIQATHLLLDRYSRVITMPRGQAFAEARGHSGCRHSFETSFFKRDAYYFRNLFFISDETRQPIVFSSVVPVVAVTKI